MYHQELRAVLLEINQFKHKLLSREFNFEECALELFHHQIKANPIYGQFCQYLGRSAQNTSTIDQIPFLPIGFFKKHQITAGKPKIQQIFESSGTTGNQTSKHYVPDLWFYTQNARLIFEEQYGPMSQDVFLFLLPSYLERNNSSLVYMAQDFLSHCSPQFSGFFLDNFEALKKQLLKALLTNKRVFLFGVTFGLLDFGEQAKLTQTFPNLIVLETGGMKGRKKELTRSEIHLSLNEHFQTPQIHSEYGMTELMSQAYSKGQGVFTESRTLRVYVRELQDPLAIHKTGKGGLNVIDLANLETCSFIATDDQGEVNPDGFRVNGRIDRSDIRGCNLLL